MTTCRIDLYTINYTSGVDNEKRLQLTIDRSINYQQFKLCEVNPMDETN